ncbi:MAG: DUF4397 domain-containing protein [Chloroflexi bacterium]|nr:DUF4397 domain-containing protein [Chloroflexota bacterium]
MRKLALVLALLALLTGIAPAFAQNRENLADTLANDTDGRFTTLVAALEAAGLTDVLTGEDEFTVMAPTDAAFEAALADLGLTAEELLADTDTLTDILLYHVIPGNFPFRNLTRASTLETALEGQTLAFDLSGGLFTVNDVAITDVDELATNGVIHAIDGVLLPPGEPAATEGAGTESAVQTAGEEGAGTESAVQTAGEEGVAQGQPATRPNLPELLANDPDGRFTTLLAAVEAAGLVETLNSEGPFTVLAPTNAAFDAAFEALGLTADELLADTDTLTDILLYHVIPGRFFFRDLTRNGGVTLDTALDGETVAFDLTAGSFTVNGIGVGTPDAIANNGIFHIIDGVLLPPAIAAALTPETANLRVAHLSPDAGPVDIYVNGELMLESVTFSTISDFMPVNAGAYRIGVAAPGEEPGGVVIGNVQPDSWVTVAAIGIEALGDLRVRFLLEDYSALDEGQARVTVFHAIQSAGVIDVRLNGNLLIGQLGYPGTLGNNDGLDIRDVTAATYDISVTPNAAPGTTLAERSGFPLSENNNYFVAVAGTTDFPQLIIRTTDLTMLAADAQ